MLYLIEIKRCDDPDVPMRDFEVDYCRATEHVRFQRNLLQSGRGDGML